MFSATAGYLTDAYQAHRSVAGMYRHIQNSNRPLTQKNSSYFPSTIQETAISIFLQALHYLQKEYVIRKLYV